MGSEGIVIPPEAVVIAVYFAELLLLIACLSCWVSYPWLVRYLSRNHGGELTSGPGGFLIALGWLFAPVIFLIWWIHHIGVWIAGEK